jgi:diaminopimelate epimerase
MRFARAHAYGNDFLYVTDAEAAGRAPDALARELCDRHSGIGADGLILYTAVPGGARMRLFNADGGRAEVSGNGVRALGALLLLDEPRDAAAVTIETDAGPKRLDRLGREGSRQTFRAAMGQPSGLRRASLDAAGERIDAVVLDMGNPQCIVLGPLPGEERFAAVGAALERHAQFPAGTNVEFAHVEAPDRVRIRIWERGVGPTLSSGTGTCAALVAAAAFGGAARAADVTAPGGTQRVEWTADGVFLTGWAEVLVTGDWRREAISS